MWGSGRPRRCTHRFRRIVTLARLRYGSNSVFRSSSVALLETPPTNSLNSPGAPAPAPPPPPEHDRTHRHTGYHANTQPDARTSRHPWPTAAQTTTVTPATVCTTGSPTSCDKRNRSARTIATRQDTSLGHTSRQHQHKAAPPAPGPPPNDAAKWIAFCECRFERAASHG